MPKKINYVYKVLSSYYSTLTDAKRALRMDGWTSKSAKKAGIKIYKIDVKTRKIVKKYLL